MRWPLFAVAVSGPSMAPTLRHGDALLAWRGFRRPPPVRPGDVVLAVFVENPNLGYVVKRAVRRIPSTVGERWWLGSDNEFTSGDSRTHGAGEVHARALLRYWPRPVVLRRRGR